MFKPSPVKQDAEEDVTGDGAIVVIEDDGTLDPAGVEAAVVGVNDPPQKLSPPPRQMTMMMQRCVKMPSPPLLVMTPSMFTHQPRKVSCKASHA